MGGMKRPVRPKPANPKRPKGARVVGIGRIGPDGKYYDFGMTPPGTRPGIRPMPPIGYPGGPGRIGIPRGERPPAFPPGYPHLPGELPVRFYPNISNLTITERGSFDGDLRNLPAPTPRPGGPRVVPIGRRGGRRG